MKENEAIERIRSGICNEIGTQRFCKDSCMYGIDKCAYSMAIQALEEIQKYRAIGTIEEFKDLKEKSVAKKPIKHGSYYVCPCCGNTEIEYCNEVDCRTIRLKRCILCGQKLDWQ